MGGLILLVLAVVVVLWVISAYNGLISLKNQVVNAWSTPSRGRWNSSAGPLKR